MTQALPKHLMIDFQTLPKIFIEKLTKMAYIKWKK